MILRVLGCIALAVLGGLVALLGSAGHRSMDYIGLVIALATTLAGAAFAKAWQSWLGFGLYALAWATTCVAIDSWHPGGSMLIVGDTLGRAWVYGGAAALVAVGAVPMRLIVGRDGSR